MWRRRARGPMISRPPSEMTVKQFKDWWWGEAAVYSSDGLRPPPVAPGDTVELTGRDGRVVVVTIIEDPNSGRTCESVKEAVNG